MELLGIGIVIGVVLGMAIVSLCVISSECKKWEEKQIAKYKSSIPKR